MVSASKNTYEKAVIALAKKQPLLRARDLTANGVPTVMLSRLVAGGKLMRVARGVYSLPSRKVSRHGSLAEVAIRVPRGVVCLLSALRVHEIGTQAPFEVWLAIPQRMVAPKLDQPRLRVIRMSDDSLANGVQAIRIEGVGVRVFSAAKTVADCFKFRNKIGIDVAIEALRDGWRQKKFTMDDLWRYAKVNRVANVMRPYLEGLTA
jgi:predicted transcriptional regulator of viral defense system